MTTVGEYDETLGTWVEKKVPVVSGMTYGGYTAHLLHGTATDAPDDDRPDSAEDQ